ncbi:kinase-like domain-containing protein [Trametes gibbosa]|nr:kinase-like domain-containing protein [Trametes gibbosa]
MDAPAPPPPPLRPGPTETQQSASACLSTGTQSTEQRTQSTEQDSQPQPEYVVDGSCWGSLVPCNPAVRVGCGCGGGGGGGGGCSEFKFCKTQRTYRVGAGARGTKAARAAPVDVVLSGAKISGLHCVIEWDGDEGAGSAVKVTDCARNGTFINGRRIGVGSSYILRDGNEIGFATHKPAAPNENQSEDYRFIFRYTPANTRAAGVHRHYDLHNELGKGSFATVMKALNKDEGRWYAVKIVHVHKLKLRDGWETEFENGVPKDPDAKRLLREIDIMQRLRHKNVCQLKERFVESDSIYLILELVEGGDLLKYLLQIDDLGRRMTEAQTGHIVHQICSALAYVHSEGVAHRDLKLENVLLTKDDPPIVKVADFGLAKAMDTFTNLHSLCGTLVYLAPEVVNPGPEGYSLVVDSWSVGIITLIMLTLDRRPYIKDKADADVKTRVSTREVNWRRLRDCRVSEPCEEFIRGLLENDPKRRTSMADACRNDWLQTQVEVMMDAAIENSFSAATVARTKPKTPARRPSPQTRPDGTAPRTDTAPAMVPCRQRSTRASTEEVAQLPSRTTLTRTATVVDDDAEVPEDTVRAYKRKVQDRSDASIGGPRADSTTERDTGSPESKLAEAARSDRSGGKKASATGAKRVRTRGAGAEVGGGDGSEEVRGLRLPRRSARLNSKTSVS